MVSRGSCNRSSSAMLTTKDASIAFLMLPGVGRQGRRQTGAAQRRVNLPDRHALRRGRRIDPVFGPAQELNPETVGFLMRTTPFRRRNGPPRRKSWPIRLPMGSVLSTPPPSWCSRVYGDWIAALVAELGDARVGFHGHENLGLGVATTVEASPRWRRFARGQSDQINASARRFGAGNGPVEPSWGYSTCGVKTGIDLFDVAAAADVVRPAMPAECPARPQCADHGYSAGLFQLPERVIRRSERSRPGRLTSWCTDPAGAGSSAARKTPGRPTHRHRTREQARVG